MINVSRRGLLGMLAAGVGAAIIRPGVLMPIKQLLVSGEPHFTWLANPPSDNLYLELMHATRRAFVPTMFADMYKKSESSGFAGILAR